MGEVLRRAAFSPNIKERADCSAAVFTADGEMLAQADELTDFAAETKAAGFTQVVLLGMGGSSLCPEVCATVSGVEDFFVLDSTVPAAVRALEERIPPPDAVDAEPLRRELDLDDVQIVLVDTPGLHRPVDTLGEEVNRSALLALADPRDLPRDVGLEEGRLPHRLGLLRRQGRGRLGLALGQARTTSSRSCGLTESTTMSRPLAAAALSSVTWILYRSAKSAPRSGRGPLAMIFWPGISPWLTSPLIIASAITPLPITAAVLIFLVIIPSCKFELPPVYR